MGSKISTGSAKCASAATFLSTVATVDRSGAGGRFSGRLSTEEQPATSKQSKIIRSITTHPAREGTGCGPKV